MTVLLDLPAELVLLIIDKITPPDDLDCFLATCRQIRQTASIRLEQHQQMKRRYGKLSWNIDPDLETSTDHPMCNDKVSSPYQLFDEIRSNPSVVYYVKRVDWICSYDYNSSTPRLTSPSAILDSILDLPLTIPHLEELGSIVEEYEDGADLPMDRDPEELIIAVLVLLLLPNLDTLGVATYWTWSNWDFSFIQSILTSHCVTDPQSDILRKLIRIEAYHSDTEGSDSMNVLRLFSLLPAVKEMVGREIGDRFDDGDAVTLDHGASCTLEVLDLYNCHIGAEINLRLLARLLTPMRNLRTLKLYLNIPDVDDDHWTTNELVQTIAQAVGNTLESLTLIFAEAVPRRCKSLRGFPELRELVVQVKALVSDDDSDGEMEDEKDVPSDHWHTPTCECFKVAQGEVPRLADILPPSLQHLTLDVLTSPWSNAVDEFDNLCLMLRDFSGEQRKLLPKLSKLTYVSTRSLPDNIRDDIKNTGVRIFRQKKRPDYRNDTPRNCMF